MTIQCHPHSILITQSTTDIYSHYDINGLVATLKEPKYTTPSLHYSYPTSNIYIYVLDILKFHYSTTTRDTYIISNVKGDKYPS